MYRDAKYFLYGGDQEFGDADMASAYVQGFLDAMRLNKIVCPVAGQSFQRQRDWVAAMVAANELEVERRTRAQVRSVIDAYGLDKRAFRGMLLDTAAVDDEGHEVDAEGRRLYTVFGDKHEPWPFYYFVNRSGEIVPESRADDTCRKVRYFDIFDGRFTIVRITALDKAAVKECLTQDILNGDPINRHYINEAMEGGMLEEYAEVIRAALRKRGNVFHGVSGSEPKATEAEEAAFNGATCGALKAESSGD